MSNCLWNCSSLIFQTERRILQVTILKANMGAGRNLLVAFLLILGTSVCLGKKANGNLIRGPIDLSSGNGRYFLSWEVDFNASVIRFDVEAQTTGFVGFGINTIGSMGGADIIIGGVGENGPYFEVSL